MILNISVEKLRPGMYVENVGLSWLDAPYLYNEEGLVRNGEQVEQIARDGYREVYINTEKGIAPEGDFNDMDDSIHTIRHVFTADVSPQVPLKAELPRAKAIYLDSIKYSKKLISSVRQGILPNYQQMEDFIQPIVESSFRNEAALLHLSKLRQYDEYTYTHCVNVALLAVVYGKFLQLPPAELAVLGVAGLLHDVGKEHIPSHILNKPGKLTEKEFRIIQQHSTEGYRIVHQQKSIPSRVFNCVLQHHEKYDGTGYPNGIQGGSIDSFSTIISIADIYDALTSKRPYKDPMPLHKALQILYGMRDKAHPSRKIEQFIKCVGVYPVGSVVQLNDRKTGVVVQVHPEQQLCPVVKVVLDDQMRRIEPYLLDLSESDARIESCINKQDLPIPPDELLP